ncbi:MAG: hypothetical protein V3T70_05185 [Phycisphaerae bacterium]
MIRSRRYPAFVAAACGAALVIGLLGPTLALIGDEKDPSSKEEAESLSKKQRPRIRWGQRRKESDARYDKRYKRTLARTRLDKQGDKTGGPTRLWTYMGHPFIVRSDISAEFTVDTAMYMEMLHREYGAAYKLLLGGVTAKVTDKIEVVVFKDRDTYTKNGGSAGSGGQFMIALRYGDRGPYWKGGHYRLMQFTDGIQEFDRWEKGTLKHEAAHMEMRLRLGLMIDYRMGAFWPINDPRWFEEGHASVFEYWDFNKTVKENFAAIPSRGRYAPVIRRLHATDKWKDFHYVWTIDPATWHKDMTSEQGFLNYAQAWSLAAYMMHSMEGRRDFRKIYNLSTRVGADRKTNRLGTRLRAWDVAFPDDEREDLETNWNGWVAEHVSREKRVPDEEYYLKRQGYQADEVDRLVKLSEKDRESLADWLEEEKKKRMDMVQR